VRRSAAHRDRRAGGGPPWALLVLGLAVVVGWILFAPRPAPEVIEPVTEVLPDEPQEPADAGTAPATYQAGPGGVLPGEGPLLVELRWLGGAQDDHVQTRRPGRLTGEVLGFDGSPAAATRLRIVGGPQDGVETVSGPDGRYLFEDLVPGTHFVEMQQPGGPLVVRVQRVASRRTTNRDFQLGETMEVPFRVVDQQDQPVAGATVSTDFGAHQGVSDAEGLAYVAGVAGGQRVLVEVRAEGFVPVRYEMNLYAALLDGDPVKLPALPKGGSVRGQVRSWPGGPLPRVTLVPRAAGPGPWSAAWETWQDVEVDGRGHFVLEGLPTTHTVDVRVFHPFGLASPRVRTTRPSTANATPLEFVVSESDARVAGRVLGPDGAPLAGARVVLAAVNPDQVLAQLYPGLDESPLSVRLPVPGAVRREVVTGRDGSFRFTVADHPTGTGHLLLTVDADGCQQARREIRTVAGDLRIPLRARDRSASLALVREDDGPLPNAVEWSLDGAQTGTLGDTVLDGLASGYYAVRVRRGDVVLVEREMQLGSDTRLDLSPRP